VTGLFGVGPVVAAIVIGDAADVRRFATRDRFAAWNGTAPVEVSSGEKKIHRLSLRGNRRVNYAIHVAAVTQIRHKHSPGRAYYDKKIAEGKTRKEALRCLKRRISDAIYARLLADARKAATATAGDPGGQPGNDSASSVAGSHPARRHFGQATPGPQPSVRPATPPRPAAHPTPDEKPDQNHLTQRGFDLRVAPDSRVGRLTVREWVICMLMRIPDPGSRIPGTGVASRASKG
jgi:transposase